MAVSKFQKRIAEEVFEKLAERNIEKFDQRAYSRVVYPLLRKEGILEGVAQGYQWRAIRTLVKKNFSKKIQEFHEEEHAILVNLSKQQLRTELMQRAHEANEDVCPID